jgi:hypothetical protein
MRLADPIMRSVDAQNEEPELQTELSSLPLAPQALIDALVDIDLAFERRCQELNNSRLGATLQYHRLEKLRVQHRERREPYVRQLIALQDRLMTKRGS